jgi:hypothetical protein
VALNQFELLELRRDDGIQTFHAREISTERPVQVHFLDTVPETLALLSRIHQLPAAERRRVLDRGVCEGRPYVVTDRLAGFANLREWLESKAAPRSLDRQFLELFDGAVFDGAVIEPAEENNREPARSRVAGVVLGVVVAIAFLVLLIGAFAFRPR